MLRIIVIAFSILSLAFSTYVQATPNSHYKTSTTRHAKHANKAKSFPESKAATGSREFIFNPRAHAWAVYNESGERVKTGRASGGKGFCPDIRRSCRTIVGTFRVLSKGGASCRSKIYPIRTHGGAPMPYCMRFSEKGYAIHGSYSVPNYNASHGCIRVPPPEAKWLSQNFMQTGTKVVVLPY
jgi:hypothetical protein